MSTGIEASHKTEYCNQNESPKTIAIAEAPGCLQFFGEHGICGGGAYLSCAIDRTMQVALSPRKDSSFRFFAADLGERKRSTVANVKYKREDRWANHIKVAISAFIDRGYEIPGLNCTVSGNVPQSVDLSSSKAIELATALALRALYAPKLSENELLNLLMEGWRSFWGETCLPLDWLTMLKAKKGMLLQGGSRNFTMHSFPASFSGYRLILTDSKVPRFEISAELEQRKKEIEKGLALLARGNTSLGFKDFIDEDLLDIMSSFPEHIRRRATFAVQESARVFASEEACKKKDLLALAKLVYASHEGLRDLMEISCPEIDWLVKRSQETDGVLCSRMTGQGFGGCIYSIIAEDAIDSFKGRLEEYERIFGFKPLQHDIRPAHAARLISVEGSNASTFD